MIWENIALAFSSLKANKMRALLTMLGIIIGIMSIIAILIIGDAMTAQVSDNLSTLGANNITVSVRERGTNLRQTSTGRTPMSDDLITDRMIEDLKLMFPNGIDGISMNQNGGNAQARDGDLYANVSINGVNADYTKANNVSMLSGNFISDMDVKGTNQSAVVSDKFVKNMFPDGSEPIGRQVKIYKSTSVELFTIIGVYKHEQISFGMSTVSDKDITTTFYIPISTAKQNLMEKNYTSMTVIALENAEVEVLTNRIQNYFDSVYASNTIWRVSAFNMSSMLDTIADTMSTISVSIAIIAGISLLVGGIGVMNIMLVSVTERTREIGTRKALGAKNYHIQFQFVTEAIIISSVGGVIGLLMGIGTGAIITSIFEVPLVISPLTTFGCVLFSMVIGIFFGLYPANKAAKLDPIEALRYE